eukprot:1154750-Pelagomonas_calceolata.AAC.1
MPHHQSTGLACKSRLTKSKDKELSAPASRLPASWYVNPRAEPCVGQAPFLLQLSYPCRQHLWSPPAARMELNRQATSPFLQETPVG